MFSDHLIVNSTYVGVEAIRDGIRRLGVACKEYGALA